MVIRNCYTCQVIIECDTTPIQLTGVGPIIPKFNAPLICHECRKDPEKLHTARVAMVKYFKEHDEAPLPVFIEREG